MGMHACLATAAARGHARPRHLPGTSCVCPAAPDCSGAPTAELSGPPRVAALQRWCIVLRELSPKLNPALRVYATLVQQPASPGGAGSGEPWQQLSLQHSVAAPMPGPLRPQQQAVQAAAPPSVGGALGLTPGLDEVRNLQRLTL